MNRIKKFRSYFLLFTILSQVLVTSGGIASPNSQDPSPQIKAQILLDKLTPEERVGQLILVEFQGSQITEDNPILSLISDYSIGGVVLKAKNDNFSDLDDPIRQTWELIRSLQQTEWNASRGIRIDPVSDEQYLPNFIPLFAAISQDGDGYPNDQILSGFTPLPSPMAIGATWNPDLAFQVGEILGRELNAVGFNLLLGPSLDILTDPFPELAGDLNTRSFGGDPYWVSVMGQSFISGVHSGSANQIGVVVKHFPGHSGADRPLEEEIPTVRKSLEQLIQIELVPFFSTTGLAQSPEAAADAVLLSHTRYQGFQGDIRASTRPISFDSQALDDLLALPEFASWVDSGGLIISEELGTRALRRFFDPSEQTFNATLVVRDAFLAGNDILNLGDIVASDDQKPEVTIKKILEFFSLKYRQDITFAQSVDASVLDILSLKYKLYEEFTLNNLFPSQIGLENIAQGDTVTFEVARQAVTLINPASGDLDTLIPEPPGPQDRIVFVTDSFPVTQCTECEEQFTVLTNALQEYAVDLYGPSAGGLVFRRNITSFTFTDLEKLLENQGLFFDELIRDMQRAQWIVFLLQNNDPERAESLAFSRFLSQRPDLIQGKNTIVFALNAPYYLDATDISKVTAYYGLYSKQPQFIEIAARLLFKELPAPGFSPVSIPGIGYDLLEITAPDPAQTIPLYFYPSDSTFDPQDPTPQASPNVDYREGDSVVLETGVILDHNGNSVPDNTPVSFQLIRTIEGTIVNDRLISATTHNGIASANFILDNGGILNFQVFSGDPPSASDILEYDVIDIDGDLNTGAATPIITPENLTPDPNQTEEPNNSGALIQEDKTTMGLWILIVMVSGFISLFAYQIGATSGKVRWGIRWALSTMIGGLITNSYLSFNLPGSRELIQAFGVWGVVVTTALGAIIGWGFGWLWSALSGRSND